MMNIAQLVDYYLQNFGYLGVCLLIEFTPLSSDVELLILGTRLDTQQLTLLGIVLSVSLFSTLWTSMYYCIAKYLGQRVDLYQLHQQRLLRFFIPAPKHLDRMKNWLDNKGVLVILLCRFVPGVRVASPFICGLLNVSWHIYSVMTFFGIAIWVGMYLVIGQYFKGGIIQLWLWSQAYSILIWLLLLICCLSVLFMYNNYKNKK